MVKSGGTYVNHPIKLVNPKCISLGSYTNIGYGARIDCICKWLDKTYRPNLKIGNGVSIGQNCTINCADSVTIEDNVVIAFGCFITDNEHDDFPVNTHLFNKKIRVSSTKIGKYTYIGCNSVILSGVHIGDNCIVGAGSIVKRDVPDNTMVAGIPARIIKRYNDISSCWEKA